eukprot:3777562-Pyramimonas_sp.AAC.1
MSPDPLPFHDRRVERTTNIWHYGEPLGLAGEPATRARRRLAEGQKHGPLWKELSADVNRNWVYEVNQFL